MCVIINYYYYYFCVVLCIYPRVMFEKKIQEIDILIFFMKESRAIYQPLLQLGTQLN